MPIMRRKIARVTRFLWILTGPFDYGMLPIRRIMRSFALFPRLELARRDSRFPVLRELAVKLLPEIGVSRQVLSFLLPDKLQRMPQPELVDDRWPIKLQHPERGGRLLGRVRRTAKPVAHLPHCAA